MSPQLMKGGSQRSPQLQRAGNPWLTHLRQLSCSSASCRAPRTKNRASFEELSTRTRCDQRPRAVKPGGVKRAETAAQSELQWCVGRDTRTVAPVVFCVRVLLAAAEVTCSAERGVPATSSRSPSPAHRSRSPASRMELCPNEALTRRPKNPKPARDCLAAGSFKSPRAFFGGRERREAGSRQQA
jgi:hypothetical protein